MSFSGSGSVSKTSLTVQTAHPYLPSVMYAPGKILALRKNNTAVVIDADALRSKSKNTPFDGWELRGAAAATIVGGRTVFTHPDVAGASVFA